MAKIERHKQARVNTTSKMNTSVACKSSRPSKRAVAGRPRDGKRPEILIIQAEEYVDLSTQGIFHGDHIVHTTCDPFGSALGINRNKRYGGK